MSADKAAAPFFDTNILVYAADISAGPKGQIARDLIEETWRRREGHLSIQVLQEFYVSITRKIPKKLNSEDGRQLIKDFSRWKVHSPKGTDLISAVDLHVQLNLSFWDAMILQSAFSLGCDAIYSEDFDMNRNYRGMKVINPFK